MSAWWSMPGPGDSATNGFAQDPAERPDDSDLAMACDQCLDLIAEWTETARTALVKRDMEKAKHSFDHIATAAENAWQSLRKAP